MRKGKQMRLIAILLLFISTNSFADYGFTYKGDLNGDGIDDYIYSGPSSLFGNGGGPCLIKVSVTIKYKQKIIHCGNREGMLVDFGNDWKPARLWIYARINVGEGVISTITLDGEFKSEGMTVYPGHSGSPESIDSLILKAIQDKGKYIKFEQVENNYTPPELSCEWGKDC